MEWQVPTLIIVGILFLLMAIGLEVGLSLAVTGILAVALFGSGIQREVIARITYNTLDSFVMTTIPLFLFIGELLQRSRLSVPFYNCVSLWLGRTPGGLLHANIVACALFAAISGTSAATAATISTVAIPEMERKGYDKIMTIGSLAAGGTLGILIPPSVPMILYGAVTDQSVGRLFIAGFIPGCLLTILFMLYIAGTAVFGKRKVGLRQEATPFRVKIRATVGVLPLFSLAVVILGGIYTGVMTPSEAAGAGAATAIVLTFVYRVFNWALLRDSLRGAVRTSCMILFIMYGAQILQYGLVYTGISRAMVKSVLALPLSPVLILGMFCLLYLFLGCIMDGLSMMLLTVPITVPAITGIGYDPIWFGIILVILIEVSLITPPVGLNLFILQGISGHPIGDVIRGSLPYLLLMWVAIALLVMFPAIALYLPSRMMGI